MAEIAVPVDGDGNDQLRVTFPHSDDKIILRPFQRELNEGVTNHEFHLQKDLYSALQSCSDLDLEFKCYYFFDEGNVWWPPQLNVTVNNTPMNIERVKPLYLKTVCRSGRNVIQITGYIWPLSFILRLVYRPSVRSVIDILLKKRLVPHQDCIARLKEYFETLGDQETNINVSLECPISGRRITIPARGDDCGHIECFDLKSYLKFVAETRELECPVCDKDLALDLLKVDQYLWGILTSLERVERNSGKTTSIENIVICPNVHWSGVTETGEIVNFPNDEKQKNPSQEDDAMDGNLNCIICKDIFHDCRRLQDCGDSFCASCYSQWYEREREDSIEHKCPTCREPVYSVKRNHLVNNFVEFYLKNNPGKRRSADELAEMDAKNKFTEDDVQITEMSAGERSAGERPAMPSYIS